MNIKKKLLTLILLLCVFFPCLTFVSACGEENTTPPPAEPEWNGSVSGDWNLISNVEDFKAFVNGVNSGNWLDKKFRLTTNIDLSKAGIDDNQYIFGGIGGGGIFIKQKTNTDNEQFLPDLIKDYAFRGEFDGNNYKISNFVINQGFYFSTSTNNGTMFAKNGGYSLAFAGFFNMLDGAKIHDVWLDSYVINHEFMPYETWAKTDFATHNIFAGGICGYAHGTNVEIKNCKVSNLGVVLSEGSVFINDGIFGSGDVEYTFDDLEGERGVSAICAMGNVSVDNCEIKKVEVATIADPIDSIVGNIDFSSTPDCVVEAAYPIVKELELAAYIETKELKELTSTSANVGSYVATGIKVQGVAGTHGSKSIGSTLGGNHLINYGKNITPEQPWYNYGTYFVNAPALRQFLEWKTIKLGDKSDIFQFNINYEIGPGAIDGAKGGTIEDVKELIIPADISDEKLFERWAGAYTDYRGNYKYRTYLDVKQEWEANSDSSLLGNVKIVGNEIDVYVRDEYLVTYGENICIADSLTLCPLVKKCTFQFIETRQKINKNTYFLDVVPTIATVTMNVLDYYSSEQLGSPIVSSDYNYPQAEVDEEADSTISILVKSHESGTDMLKQEYRLSDHGLQTYAKFTGKIVNMRNVGDNNIVIDIKPQYADKNNEGNLNPQFEHSEITIVYLNDTTGDNTYFYGRFNHNRTLKIDQYGQIGEMEQNNLDVITATTMNIVGATLYENSEFRSVNEFKGKKIDPDVCENDCWEWNLTTEDNLLLLLSCTTKNSLMCFNHFAIDKDTINSPEPVIYQLNTFGSNLFAYANDSLSWEEKYTTSDSEIKFTTTNGEFVYYYDSTKYVFEGVQVEHNGLVNRYDASFSLHIEESEQILSSYLITPIFSLVKHFVTIYAFEVDPSGNTETIDSDVMEIPSGKIVEIATEVDGNGVFVSNEETNSCVKIQPVTEDYKFSGYSISDGNGIWVTTFTPICVTSDLQISIKFEMKTFKVTFVKNTDYSDQLVDKEVEIYGSHISYNSSDDFSRVTFTYCYYNELSNSLDYKSYTYTSKNSDYKLAGFTFAGNATDDRENKQYILEDDISIQVFFIPKEMAQVEMRLDYGNDASKENLQIKAIDINTAITFEFEYSENTEIIKAMKGTIDEGQYSFTDTEPYMSYTAEDNGSQKWKFDYVKVYMLTSQENTSTKGDVYVLKVIDGVLKYGAESDLESEYLDVKDSTNPLIYEITSRNQTVEIEVYFVRIIEVTFNNEIINAEGLKDVSNYTPEEFDFSTVEGSKYILEIRSNSQKLTRNDDEYEEGSTSTLTFGVSDKVSVQGLEKLKEYEIDRYYLSCGWLISLGGEDVNKGSRNTNEYYLPDMNDVGRKITITPIVHLNAIKFVLSYDSNALGTNKLEQQEGMVEGIDKIGLDENNLDENKPPLKATIYFEFETIIQYNHTKKSSNYVLIELMISYSSVGNENYKCFEIELKTKSAQNGVSGLCGATSKDEVEKMKSYYNYCVLDEGMENYVLNFSIDFGAY